VHSVPVKWDLSVIGQVTYMHIVFYCHWQCKVGRELQLGCFAAAAAVVIFLSLALGCAEICVS